MPSSTTVGGESLIMTNGSQDGVNGSSNTNTNGHTNGHASRTPSLSGLSLTEYSANPTPPSEATPTSRITDIIPPEFILPSGHPDVGLSPSLPLTTTAS